MTENRFNKRINITPEILFKITKIDEFKGLWRGSINLNPQILKRLKSTVIITSTGASTRIEGSKMSDEEIARLLRGLKSTPPKNRDEEEVAGYADLIGRIFDHYKDLKLTENNILHFHSILLNYSAKDQSHKGKYKNSDNVVAAVNEKGEEVIIFKATPPYLVKPEIEALLAWANAELNKKELHPILFVANFVFEFLAIHPFNDGNGRLSRALTNLLLLQADYVYIPYVSLEEIIENTKTEYYMALHKTQNNHKTDHEDITPWVNYLLDSMIVHAEKAKKLMSGEQPEKLLAESQEKILALFDSGKNGGDKDCLNISEITKILDNAPREAIKKNLARLVELRLLELVGRGRGARYKKIIS